MKKNSLSLETAKLLVHAATSQTDKALIALASLDKNSSVRDIAARLAELGVSGVTKWNLSRVLSSGRGQAIRTNAGWELSAPTRARVNKEAASFEPESALGTVNESLRKLLPRLSNVEVKTFIEEAIGCVENRLLKAAVVFSWVGAIAVLQDHVATKHLNAFNQDAVAKDPKWRAAKNAEGLGLMKEADFLDALVRIGALGKNVKTELKHCLDLRNACGHPNSLVVGEAKVSAHIETLVQNVFQNIYAGILHRSQPQTGVMVAQI